MSPFANFAIEFGLSLLVFGLLGKWYVWPFLQARPVTQSLLILLVPFLPRYLGLMSLVPGVVDPAVTRSAFAFYQAYGDFLAFVLAFAAFVLVRGRNPHALTAVWVFNIFGTVDFLHAVLRGILSGTGGGLGAFWYIPVCYVPLGLVLHYLIFAVLVTRSGEYRQKAA
ncbi:MAG TPA: hypothetical protein VEH30_09165 [Terriglobales bacterium]|nr:hypothetical protein [Terriglobales bacterium]